MIQALRFYDPIALAALLIAGTVGCNSGGGSGSPPPQEEAGIATSGSSDNPGDASLESSSGSSGGSSGSSSGSASSGSSAPGTCTQDPTVACSVGSGYSCTGSATLEGNKSLNCGGSVPINIGLTGYCCTTVEAAAPPTNTMGMCAMDSMIMCSAGTTGYFCTGDTVPTVRISGLTTCSMGTPEGLGSVRTDFCCM